MYNYLWIFFILSIVGWIIEVIYASIVEKKFINRGFLSGPFCPIYGIGAVAIYFALNQIESVMLLFLGSMLIGSAVEWIAGFVLEKIFGQRWWDYSDDPYNLNGYICLAFSVFWGCAGVVVVKFLMPLLLRFVAIIPYTLGVILLIALSVSLIADLILTLLTFAGLQKKLHNLETMSQKMKIVSESLGKAVSDAVINTKDKYDDLDLKEKYKNISEKTSKEFKELKEKYEQSINSLKEQKLYSRFIKAFPSSSSKKYNEQLDKLKETLNIISGKTPKQIKRREELAEAAYQPKTKGNNQKFAQGINFSKLFWIFMMGCLIGFILETVWCLVRPPHQFQLRVGVLYGPFIPIYGLGAVAMTIFLYRLYNKSNIFIFFACALIGGVFEYICGLVQEIVFGSVSWDYSDSFLSLGGRVNLMFAVFWGMIGLVWIKDIYPRLSALVEKMPVKTGRIITSVVAVLMAVNLLLSAMAVYRQKERLHGVPASNSISNFLDKYYDDDALAIRFSNMTFVNVTPEPDLEEITNSTSPNP